MTIAELTTLDAECAAFVHALRALPDHAWERPTRCEPWTVRDVVGHVVTVLGRVPVMVAAAAPASAEVSATGYYRADDRFGAEANTERVRVAQAVTGDLATRLADIAAEVRDVCSGEPDDRLVRTRHGDAMLLGDFLLTRIVEAAVHGLDVADAAGVPPWLTETAGERVLGLLFGPAWRESVAALGGDPLTVIRTATGRAPVTPTDQQSLEAAGLRPLTLG
ncbi:maleylpyruvate isomerase N-terminal domain-containing protein [Actinoplanes flavus]|uniref:maleylpyruvate isomerase N-terminal domain-containing protein n=1 Tax=Actinoplanes flavus TaxID=2820290 RepID=UPI0027DBF96D|nr:maleylpyruvate isomerase N-terminal domain-containing protein [Actinoplanes flavus]